MPGSHRPPAARVAVAAPPRRRDYVSSPRRPVRGQPSASPCSHRPAHQRQNWTVRPRPTPGTRCRALATASDPARGELSSALQLAARRPAARPYASTRSRQLAYAPMRPYSTRSKPAGVQRPPAHPLVSTFCLPSSPLVLSVTSHGTSHGPRTTICTEAPPGTKGAEPEIRIRKFIFCVGRRKLDAGSIPAQCTLSGRRAFLAVPGRPERALQRAHRHGNPMGRGRHGDPGAFNALCAPLRADFATGVARAARANRKASAERCGDRNQAPVAYRP